jgi:hypothetical protein
MTVIGYTIDLDKKLVLISRRNAKKVLYSLTTVSKNGPVTVKMMQKLVSWDRDMARCVIFCVLLFDLCISDESHGWKVGMIKCK